MKDYPTTVSKLSIEGKTLRVERDVIAVSMLDPVEVDPDWVFVDDAGHSHRWVDGQLPTIDYVETDRWWCSDCRDEHLETEPRCKACGAKIEPGYRRGRNPEYITGATHYFLDDVEITEAEAKTLFGGA